MIICSSHFSHLISIKQKVPGRVLHLSEERGVFRASPLPRDHPLLVDIRL